MGVGSWLLGTATCLWAGQRRMHGAFGIAGWLRAATGPSLLASGHIGTGDDYLTVNIPAMYACGPVKAACNGPCMG